MLTINGYKLEPVTASHLWPEGYWRVTQPDGRERIVCHEVHARRIAKNREVVLVDQWTGWADDVDPVSHRRGD